MTNHISLLLLSLALIMVVAQGCGALARRLGQPAVIGEILAGVLLGPTLFAGKVSETLIVPEVRPLLTPLASLGIALFMFLVGLELDRSLVAGRRRVMTGVAVSTTLVPFALGVALAGYLLTRYPTENGLAFALFVGVATAATAFPVLARILRDRGMQRTPVGSLSLGVAAISDVVVWSVLAGVVILAGGSGSEWRIMLVIPYVAVMMLAVRPLLRRLGAGTGGDAGRLVVIVVGVLVSGGATEWIGLHFAFGAFLFGFVFPKDDDFRHQTARRVGTITSLLLPVYFVTAGLTVDLSQVGVSDLADLGLIMLVAAGGKLGAGYLTARLLHVPARESATLAALLNTRGLTELVILGIGLQQGLLRPDLYSLMVVMALVTTAMTAPLLTLVERRDRRVLSGP